MGGGQGVDEARRYNRCEDV
jgi:hypothetical protein